MSNSDNPKIGARFQLQVKEFFQKKYEREFILEKKVAIGNPPKDHKFDIIDCDNKIVVECKRYTWTESGNVPSAKMGFCNEAAFYLTLLPDTYDKYIVMLKSFNSKRNETLAEYYYKTNRHLLGNIVIAEFCPETEEFRIVGCNK